MNAEPDWINIGQRLTDAFDPSDVDFRVQGKANASGKVQVLAYIDARAVQERLDAVVGPQNWNFDWSVVSLDSKGEIVSAKGTLTIYGIAKSDVGVASTYEGDKGAVSGAQKRAAVQWGIGRYLYALPATWIPDPGRFLSDITLAQLRKKLPRPGVPQARTAAYQEMPASASTEVIEAAGEAESSNHHTHTYDDCQELSERLGYDHQTFRAGKNKYDKNGGAEAMYQALLVKLHERDDVSTDPDEDVEAAIAAGELPPRTRPVVISEQEALVRLHMKANGLGYSKAQWDGLVEDCHGDLDVIAQALEHAAQTDLRGRKKTAGVH